MPDLINHNQPHNSHADSMGPIASVDLQALRHNALIAKQARPSAKLLCVIKADAYGHGWQACATALEGIADGWAVARWQEAFQLREAGFSQVIVVMSPQLPSDNVLDLWQRCAAQNITPLLHDNAALITDLKYCKQYQITPWINIDTGMHRLGIDPLTLTTHLAALPDHMVLMSHFADADESRPRQLSKQLDTFFNVYNAAQLLGRRCGFSLDNSAALLREKTAQDNDKYEPGGTQWIRPGIMLYGANPLAGNSHLSSQLLPVMQLTAPVIALRHIAKGESVGYNGIWQAPRSSTIATVAIGYADGYPRHAANGTAVAIHGRKAPLVGRVSMDMITVDITELCNAGIDVAIGDRVELWGTVIPAVDIANNAHTISYDLFTGIGNRVARRYINR